MKRYFSFIGLCTLVCMLSCGVAKKKKFLDYFTSFKGDSLSIATAHNDSVYKDSKADVTVKGTPIDSMHWSAMRYEDVDELLYYVPSTEEFGPIAYYKIKLDVGNYLVIIRSGGEYRNSRFYACLYNEGENRVYDFLLIAEDTFESSELYTCSSVFKKENKVWNFVTEHSFVSGKQDAEGQMQINVKSSRYTYSIVTNTDGTHEEFKFLLIDKYEGK